MGIEWMDRLAATARPGYRMRRWRPIEQAFREDGYAELWAAVILAAERAEESIGCRPNPEQGRE